MNINKPIGLSTVGIVLFVFGVSLMLSAGFGTGLFNLSTKHAYPQTPHLVPQSNVELSIELPLSSMDVLNRCSGLADAFAQGQFSQMMAFIELGVDPLIVNKQMMELWVNSKEYQITCRRAHSPKRATRPQKKRSSNGAVLIDDQWEI